MLSYLKAVARTVGTSKVYTEEEEEDPDRRGRWSRHATTLEAKVSVPISHVERPKPRLVRPDEFPVDEYYELAEDLKFNPIDLFIHKATKFFADNNIQIYDNNLVHQYLKSICPPNKEVVWLSLKKYQRAIPLEVLRLAKMVKDAGLTFCRNSEENGSFSSFLTVSDFRVPNPDPFMALEWYAATAARWEDSEQGRIVFAVWDEPGFFLKEQ